MRDLNMIEMLSQVARMCVVLNFINATNTVLQFCIPASTCNQTLYYPSSAEKIGQFSLPAVRMPYRALGSNLLRRFMQRTAFLP
ncbi:hypothetical protein VU576_20500, partial [Escherichia coli]